MKFTRRDAAKLLALPVLFHASKQVFPEAAAASRTDPAFREAVQAAMLEYIDAAKIKGYSLIFDPIKGDFVKARFKKLHNNLSLVADSFYVSCADYETEDGKLLDVDFMVAEQDGFYAVFQSVIHMRDGKLRGEHMEDSKLIFAKSSGCCAAQCGATCGAKCGATCGAKCGATCGATCGAKCGASS